MTETRIDVKVEQVESAPAEKKHPNTCPSCGSHLPRRRARGSALRLRPVRPPLPHAGARPHRLARRPGLVRRGGRRGPLGRPALVLRPAALPRAARRGRAEHRPHRRDRRRRGHARRAAARARGDGLLLHGRLDGERRRREVRPRLRRRDRSRDPAAARLELGRRADAGGDPLADAAPEDDRRDRRAPRGRAAAVLPCSPTRRPAARWRASPRSAT